MADADKKLSEARFRDDLIRVAWEQAEEAGFDSEDPRLQAFVRGLLQIAFLRSALDRQELRVLRELEAAVRSTEPHDASALRRVLEQLDALRRLR